MQKRNCITSALCAAVFAFFLVQCNSLKEAAAYWPRMICITGIVLTMLEILLEGVKWYRAANKQERFFPLTGAQLKRAAILLGILILWSVGLNRLGFLVSSLGALCAISLYFEPIHTSRTYLRDVIVCLVIGIAVYYLFGYLGVHYPRALLV